MRRMSGMLDEVIQTAIDVIITMSAIIVVLAVFALGYRFWRATLAPPDVTGHLATWGSRP